MFSRTVDFYDTLEPFMRAILFLLKRYLFPERSNLTAIALWLSVAGVSIGIIQLMLVLSVMSGFQKFLRDHYTTITSEIVVLPKPTESAAPDFRLGLEGTRGVAAATAFGLGAGMLLKNGVGGIVLEGIDLDTSSKVTPWEKIWVEKPDPVEQGNTPYWIWLGEQLARKLKVKQHDTVNVMIADGDAKKVLPFKVTAITKFGIYDHDLHYARIDLRLLNNLFRRTASEPMYKVRVKPESTIEATADALKEKLGRTATVKQWSEINQNIFLAVQHQKQMLFLVLEIVIALAAMNVVNLLMMSTHQRKRDIAILRAMGFRFRSVVWFFVAQGVAVGSVGVGLGIVLGYGACRLAERFQPTMLSESIYNVTRLPIRVELLDVFIISGVAMALCMIFSLMPAIRAAMARPVDALRYE